MNNDILILTKDPLTWGSDSAGAVTPFGGILSPSALRVLSTSSGGRRPWAEKQKVSLFIFRTVKLIYPELFCQHTWAECFVYCDIVWRTFSRGELWEVNEGEWFPLLWRGNVVPEGRLEKKSMSSVIQCKLDFLFWRSLNKTNTNSCKQFIYTFLSEEFLLVQMCRETALWLA